MSSTIRHLVLEMTIGMAAYGGSLGIAALVFRKGLEALGMELFPVLTGLFLGFLADVCMLVHMALITERAAESMNEGYANKTTVIQSMLRRVIFIAFLFLAGSRPQVDAVAMIIGALGLQPGALLQPAVHRIFFADPPGEEGRPDPDPITEERRKKYGDDADADHSA